MRNNYLHALPSLIALAIVLAGCDAQAFLTSQSGQVTTRTHVYLMDLYTEDSRLCHQVAVPYTIDILPNEAPLNAAIVWLLNNPDPPTERLRNGFEQTDMALEHIEIEDSHAVIYLTGQVITPQVCDPWWMPEQLRRTALQFEVITSVELLLNGEPFQTALDRPDGPTDDAP